MSGNETSFFWYSYVTELQVSRDKTEQTIVQHNWTTNMLPYSDLNLRTVISVPGDKKIALKPQYRQRD
jgi:hypothetical protein